MAINVSVGDNLHYTLRFFSSAHSKLRWQNNTADADKIAKIYWLIADLAGKHNCTHSLPIYTGLHGQLPTCVPSYRERKDAKRASVAGLTNTTPTVEKEYQLDCGPYDPEFERLHPLYEKIQHAHEFYNQGMRSEYLTIIAEAFSIYHEMPPRWKRKFDGAKKKLFGAARII